MKTFRLLSILLAAGLAASCMFNENNVPADSSAPRYHATAESAPQTATSFERGEGMARVVWNSGDRISVFAKSTLNRQYSFVGEDGAASGDFEEVPGGGSGDALPMSYAVYPYSEGYSISAEGVVSLVWPASQSYRAANYDSAAAVMFARSEDTNLSFIHAGGYLCISLYGQGVNVRSLALSGESEELLAGPARIWAEKEGQVETVGFAFREGAVKTITLTAASPVALGADKAGATEFWFCLPPTAFKNGFAVTVTDDGGRQTVFRTSKNISVERAGMRRMEPVRIEMNGAVPSEPGIYEASGSSTVFDAAGWQLSRYNSGGKAWLRAVDLINLKVISLGPVPAEAKAGLMINAQLEEFAFASPEDKTSRQLMLRVVSVADGSITLIDEENTYYLMRF